MKLADLSPIERMDYISRPADLLRLAPLSQIEAHKEGRLDRSTVDSLHRAIAALRALDLAVQQSLDYFGHAYLLGDDGLGLLLDRSDAAGVSGMGMGFLGECLSALGFLYRFNVAKKFGYPSRRLFQLRLNGWGRHLAELKELDQTEGFQRCLAYCRTELARRKRDYSTLVSLCNASARPLNVQEIHRINAGLDIKLVT